MARGHRRVRGDISNMAEGSLSKENNQEEMRNNVATVAGKALSGNRYRSMMNKHI